MLAELSDLEARLGVQLSGSDAERADALLRDASAAFVGLAGGQQIEQATSTVRLRVRHRKVRLPQRPVVSVTSVVDLNAVAVTYDHRDGVLYLDPAVPDSWAWEPRRTGLTLVDVTYTHGFEAVPDDVVAVVCQVAGRAYGTPSNSAGITQENLGAYGYQTGGAAGAGPLGFLADERAVAERYGRQLGEFSASQ